MSGDAVDLLAVSIGTQFNFLSARKPTSIMRFLGIDIGGANIKLATSTGHASAIPFALWREPQRLGEVLSRALSTSEPFDAIAATTTAELADCFATKREGVREIYTALKQAAAGRSIAVYLTDGRFVEPDEAIASPELAAASNWHALARFAGRFATSGTALLIDVGSTTTDIIPIRLGEPDTRGKNDTERLVYGELVYTGATRTPTAALVHSLPWRGRECPIMRELFSTVLDAHLILGNVPEDPQDTNTADGRPATRSAARDRLARMIGADRESFDDDNALQAAQAIGVAQRRLIGNELRRVLDRMTGSPQVFLVSGQGEFLARQVLDELQIAGRRMSLGQQLGANVSQSAAAYAVAVLAEEMFEIRKNKDTLAMTPS